MRTSAAGNKRAPTLLTACSALRGFTLIELLVVIAIVAIATAGVSFALRTSGETQLEREAQRLAALLESARAQSRSSGVAVRWTATPGGFHFDGVPQGTLPEQWLAPTTQVQGNTVLLLGPDPIIGRQQVVISSSSNPDRSLTVATDGLRPFRVAREGS